MDSNIITKYDIKYLDVLCTGVMWRYPELSVFYFINNGKEYEFVENYNVYCSADTDYIRIVIKWQFLPWLEKKNS